MGGFRPVKDVKDHPKRIPHGGGCVLADINGRGKLSMVLLVQTTAVIDDSDCCASHLGLSLLQQEL